MVHVDDQDDYDDDDAYNLHYDCYRNHNKPLYLKYHEHHNYGYEGDNQDNAHTSYKRAI